MAVYTALTAIGLLLAPWAALTALVGQKDALERQLERAWPELEVVAQVRNRREAILRPRATGEAEA